MTSSFHHHFEIKNDVTLLETSHKHLAAIRSELVFAGALKQDGRQSTQPPITLPIPKKRKR